MTEQSNIFDIAQRFRGFLPVVVDIETAGLNPQTDAILEIAAIIICMDEKGLLYPKSTHFCHIHPFEGANLDKSSLEFNNIDPYHPFRFAISEKEALQTIYQPIRKAIKKYGCHRAILVGHNPSFDLTFLQMAAKRCNYKRDPFHPFTTFDTATLAGLVFKHTVLAVATKKAGIDFDSAEAHSALYDAKKTTELFCYIVNNFKNLSIMN